MSLRTMSIERPKCLQNSLEIKEKLLMTAGLTNTNPRIRAAMSLPLLNPIDPQFQQILRDIVEGIRYIFQTNNRYSFAITGPTCLAFEIVVNNILEANDKIIVVVHGMAAEIIAKTSKALGLKLIRLNVNPGDIVEINTIRAFLETNKPKLLFLSHGDATSGSLQPLRGIGALCHQNNCLFMVDVSATVCCAPLPSDQLEIDVLIAGTNYALGLSAGLSLMSFNYRSTDVINKRKKDKISYLMNFDLLVQSWGLGDSQKYSYHYTPSVSLLYALRESLAMVVDEGLEQMIGRHIKHSLMAQKEITKIGLRFLADDESKRLPSVLVIAVPDNIKRDPVVEYLLKYYDISISKGISPIDRVWRIGILGQNANRSAVKLLTTVIREAIEKSKTNSTKNRLSSPSNI